MAYYCFVFWPVYSMNISELCIRIKSLESTYSIYQVDVYMFSCVGTLKVHFGIFIL